MRRTVFFRFELVGSVNCFVDIPVSFLSIALLDRTERLMRWTFDFSSLIGGSRLLAFVDGPFEIALSNDTPRLTRRTASSGDFVGKLSLDDGLDMVLLLASDDTAGMMRRTHELCVVVWIVVFSLAQIVLVGDIDGQGSISIIGNLSS